ncbi:MAG: hypothetical protein ACXVGF_04510 [Blastococcus sp.]
MLSGETEKTIVMVLDLPEGTDWRWLPDCNILAVSSRLCPAERERAIDDLQATWRRSLIHIVDADDDGERLTA